MVLQSFLWFIVASILDLVFKLLLGNDPGSMRYHFFFFLKTVTFFATFVCIAWFLVSISLWAWPILWR